MGVEVDHTDTAVPERVRYGRDIRDCHAMVASEDKRDRAGVDDLANEGADVREGTVRVPNDDVRVAVVTDI